MAVRYATAERQARVSDACRQLDRALGSYGSAHNCGMYEIEVRISDRRARRMIADLGLPVPQTALEGRRTERALELGVFGPHAMPADRGLRFGMRAEVAERVSVRLSDLRAA